MILEEIVSGTYLGILFGNKKHFRNLGTLINASSLSLYWDFMHESRHKSGEGGFAKR